MSIDESAFGAAYARYYDLFCRDKDYRSECDLIERIMASYADGAAASMLDLGCGTGSHAIALAQRGHEVVGVDRSPWMVAEAQRKLAVNGHDLPVTFRQGDLRSLDLERPFDVVLMMFGVLGYQEEDADVRAAFTTARRHVSAGGLLLCEVWFGPAVLHQGPSTRDKTVSIAGAYVSRSATATLDVDRHVCSVRFHTRRVGGAAPIVDAEETHHVRYFFREELERFLKASSFSLVRLGAFPAFEREPDEESWNVLAVARAV